MTDPQRMLTWRRFVRADEVKGDELVEIAADGRVIWERRGRVGTKEPRVVRSEVRSDEAAARGVKQRITNLLAKEFWEEGTAQHPVPEGDTREIARAEREADAVAAREQLERGLRAFVQAWRDAGFDPRLDFAAQAARPGAGGRATPNEIAERCLSIAATTLHLHVSRMEYVDDGDHGGRVTRRIKPVEAAAFYVGPARVAAISRLAGRFAGTDGPSPERKGGGWDGYGVEDEMRALIAQLVQGETLPDAR